MAQEVTRARQALRQEVVDLAITAAERERTKAADALALAEPETPRRENALRAVQENPAAARDGWNMRTERTRSLMCAGVVPQQPPTAVAPASRKRRAQVAVYSGVHR